jgi:hypothetical protein
MGQNFPSMPTLGLKAYNHKQFWPDRRNLIDYASDSAMTSHTRSSDASEIQYGGRT